MLSAAMVFMILAGILGVPAVLCSAACGGLGRVTGANITAAQGQAIVDFLTYLALAASLGSIIIGALARKLKKAVSGSAAFIFCICFALQVVIGNTLGLVSSGMLLIASLMILVAPKGQPKKLSVD